MSIETVGVIGSGLMGRFIAQATASAGVPTILIKRTPGEHKQKEMPNLILSNKLADVDLCDLVIESIKEDLSEKQKLFQEIDPLAKSKTIFASNTSTLSIAELANQTRANRFLGTHFFNPPSVAKLVEVVQTPKVDTGVVEEVQTFVRNKLGLTPLVVSNTPGFIVNRFMMNSLVYAILCLEDGLAKMEDMDQAIKLGLVHPMGPFELCDHVGLDTILSMARILHKNLRDERFRPPALLQRLVESQMLGRKSKLGFYDYNTKPKCPNSEVAALINWDKRSLAY
ncbi:MAG: 3-hydroxybutyryl-CoA dehydrogenase [Parcubacteria group bacterium Gr01-1014_13]|nr:MAG: 3-hydroxybutyryl-CoA dehydrogenase [Parcubacteria group bacterium Gr01-1014_13]